MLAVIEHILEAVERQRADQEVREHVDANSILIDLERVLRTHRDALQDLATQYGAGGESIVKKALTEALGIVAGLYDRIRDHRVSRMLRDDYVALSLAAMSYTSLHAFALAIHEDRLAQAALQHLEDITPIMVEISRTLPELVVTEVGDRLDKRVEIGAIQAAVQNTQRAWEATPTRSD
jgi:hypothetical protein